MRSHSRLAVSLLTVACAIACLVSSARGADPAPAQPDLLQLYNQAATAFAAGDYTAAAAGMEKVVAQAPPDSKLEPVYYTLGASYFNLGQFDKAVETLRSYRTKFPAGAHLTEATFSLGEASLLTHDNQTAVEAFKSLENNPAYRQQALFYEASAQKEAGQTNEAIATLERLLSAGVRDNSEAKGALMLAGLYMLNKQSDKALALFKLIQQNIALLDDVSQLNTLATQTGDALLAEHRPEDALTCYRIVRTRAEVIRLQAALSTGLEKEIARHLAEMKANPSQAQQLLAANNRLRSALQESNQRGADFEKLPDFMPGLLLRLASCYSQMDRKWEAIVADDELLRRYPDDPATREPALFSLIACSADVGRLAKAHDLAARYLKDFPQGPNADTVGYLLGELDLRTNDTKAATTYFGNMLAAKKGGQFRDTMRFELGNGQFALGDYDKAQATYMLYGKEFPNGSHHEEADYRAALCAVFLGNYEKAMGLLNGYLKTYPQGQFVPDGLYRLAVCEYAASQYDEVITECIAWEKRFGPGPLLGEVLSLRADALASKDDNAAAVDIYLRAYQAASTDEVSDYAIFAAQKLLQKAGDWDRIGQIFETFLRDHPDRPSAVMAVYWIGKARSHQDRSDEAKKFVADTIKKYIADPNRDAVEQLLTQLATLCVRKSAPPVASASASASASPAASPAAGQPVEAPTDPGAEMDALLGGAETNASPLARARVLFAKSELARLRRQPAAQGEALEQIATKFKPEELSAPLLAVAGDWLLEKGRFDQASTLFERLMNVYPKSNYLDFAYNGLGQAAYHNKDYPLALRLFTDAVDKAGATAKLMDVTVGRAKTLLAMNRLDEAKALFEQVASTREWRGESTAFAVYSLGEIMQKENKLPEAIAYYQRVFVAYGRYLPWVAKAYVASAECFTQLGKNVDAANTYREMLRNPKLLDFSEAQTARDNLGKITQG
jgi:TolA-binding protein